MVFDVSSLPISVHESLKCLFMECKWKCAKITFCFVFICHTVKAGPWKYCLTFNRSMAQKRLGTSALNYLPITLICCLLRSFESILNRNIMKTVSAHNLLSPIFCPLTNATVNHCLYFFILFTGNLLDNLFVSLLSLT